MSRPDRIPDGPHGARWSRLRPVSAQAEAADLPITVDVRRQSCVDAVPRRGENEEGSVSAEYVMIASGVAAAILVAVSAFGERVVALFTLG